MNLLNLAKDFMEGLAILVVFGLALAASYEVTGIFLPKISSFLIRLVVALLLLLGFFALAIGIGQLF